jgi:hypothetical protein
VLREELEIDRLQRQLLKMAGQRLDLHALKRPGPLAFALLVEGMRETVSTEKLADRIARMVADLEEAANKEMPDHLAIEHCAGALAAAGQGHLLASAAALLVADVHIGKAASYRALHQPVPRGTTERPSRGWMPAGPVCLRQLIVLGDFLHARSARAPATLARLQAWRDRHSALQIADTRQSRSSTPAIPRCAGY